MKIDNNPFAKGFRELGQSRIKRKFPLKTNSTLTENSEKKLKTSNELFDYQTMKENKIGRKRSNSLSESTTSADESDNSVGDEISSSSLSGTSSPATSAHEFSAVVHNESDDYAALKTYDSNRGNCLPPVGRHPSSEWIDLMTLHYIQANGNFSPHHQPLFYPPTTANYNTVQFKQTPFIPTSAIDLMHPYDQMPSPEYLPTIPANLEQPKKLLAHSPPKKSGFSISAILGCES